MNVLGNFKLEDINLRREKNGGEEGPLGIDVKLQRTMKSQECEDLFTSRKASSAFLDGIWDESGDLVSADFSKIELNSQIVGGEARLAPEFSDPRKFDGVKLNRIVLKPKSSREAVVTMRLQMPVSNEDIAWVSEYLHGHLTVTVNQPQGELDLERIERDATVAPKPPKAEGKGEAKAGKGEAKEPALSLE